MMDICVYSLFSGSKGNCYYFRIGPTEFLIDMGTSCRATVNALLSIGTCPEKISAIFISHEHIDHVAGLDVFSKKYHVPIYMLRKSVLNFPKCIGADLRSCVHAMDLGYEVALNHDVVVRSVATSHDSAAATGFCITLPNEGIRIGSVTDTGYVTEDMCSQLLGVKLCIIESNHDLDMLMRGDYPYMLKCRIRSHGGHLSNDDCAQFVRQLEEHGLRCVMLAHLSEENNDPDLARKTVERALQGNTKVFVASQYEPVLLYEGRTDLL